MPGSIYAYTRQTLVWKALITYICACIHYAVDHIMYNLPVTVTPLSMTWTTMSLLAGLSSTNMAITGPRFSVTLCADRSNRMASM